jgi:chitodextrinase
VRAADAAANLGPYSNVASATIQASDTQAPTAPTSLVATAASAAQINLSWGASTDNVAVTGYAIARCQGAGCTTLTQIATPSGTGTTFSDMGLTASTSYTYQVRAIDAANNQSSYSAPAGATTTAQATGIALVQHTSKDAGTTASSALAFTTSNIAGNWIGVAIRAGQTGQTFTVSDTRGNTYRKAVQLNETVDGTTVALYYAESIAGGTNTVTVSDTIGGGTLRFAILEYSGLAVANSLDGTASAQGTGTTPNSGTTTTTASGDLIIGLVSTANGVTVTAGSGYAIQDHVPAAPNTKLVTEDQRQTAAGPVAATATLSAADSWGAVVSAFRAGGSGAADTVPPSAPGALTATAVSGTRIDLQWSPATDNVGVTGYRVEQCQGAGCTNFVKTATVTGTTYSDTALTPNTTYRYVVRATDAATLLGAYSNIATASSLSTTPELIAAYSFNEGAGTTAGDASGNGNTGTLANAAWTTAGKYGNALVFNGTNARVSIADRASLHLTTGMTLEAWVNPSAITSAWRDVIYKGSDNYFLAAATTTSSRPAAGVKLGASSTLALGPSALTPNTWTHLAATYEGSTLRLYLNGTQAASVVQTGTILTSTNPLEIGGDSIFGQFFQGMIDEVRIYNVALTPTQIQADMNSALGGSFPVASLSATNLAFASRPIGSTSPTQIVTLTNVGTAPMTISSIAVGGVNNGDFAQSNTCGPGLAPSASCSISVTFTPAAVGARSGDITIADNAAGAPHRITLSGSGGSLSIAPRTSVLTPNLAQQFTTAGGTSGVTWSVDGVQGGSAASGTITAGGSYVPPGTIGMHTVTVTTSDGLQASSATVYVTNHPGVFTHHNDNFRTGQNLNESVLKPTNVSSASFGKLASYALDGNSHASPLYVAGINIPGQGIHNVVYVATEHNSVYAFDADGLSATPLWKVSFINPAAGVTTVPSNDTGECCDIAPEIGITGTPVIDSGTSTLYVVAKTKEISGGTTTYRQRLHALDLTTGAEKFGGPVVLQASVPGTGGGAQGGNVPFDALRENQRPALLLSNGVVYIGFGAHGDIQPYHGWLLGYDAATLQRVFVHNSSPNDNGAGMWQANGGPAVDAAGNIYFVTGNGLFDVNTGGKNYGDSFVKISPSGSVMDYFTPYDQANISGNNFDLGAAGPLLLPDQPGLHPHLLVSAGKDNTIYLLDRDAMGHYNASNNNQIVQSLVNAFPFGRPEPGNFSSPVYFNGTVYFGPVADTIQAFTLTNGRLSTTPTSASSVTYSYPGATLAVSANGAANGILWAIQRNGDCGVQVTCGSASPGVLRAYDAGNLGLQLYSSDQAGTRDALDFAAKFSVPLVVNGKVFVSTIGRLTIYGLLP